MLKEVKTLFEALSSNNKQLVRTKKFEAVAAPIDLYEQLTGVHQYAKKISKLRPDDKHALKKKQLMKNLSIYALFIPVLIWVLVMLFIFAKPFFWVCVWILLGLVLLGMFWWWRDIVPRWRRRQMNVRLDVFDFLMPLLLLLQEELKPGEKLHLKLNLHKNNQHRLRYKTKKNYIVMPHRVIVRWLPLFLLLSLVSYGVARFWFLDALPAGMLDVVIVGAFFLMLVFFPFLILLGGSLFGKSPKVKTIIRQAPKLDLQARLADGTLLHVNVTHLTMLTTSVKKKIKVKNYRTAKTKKKHKTKTVTTVKMAFPQRQYPLSKETFMNRFSKKPRISRRTIAKMKRKPGEKRNTVIYTDVITQQGQGHKSLFYAMPDFDWFAKLIMEGGYHPLRGITQDKAKTQSVSLDVDRDNLTTIGGIGRATEAKLYGAGVFTFAQLANMSKVEFHALLKKVDISPKQATDWQKQAKELM
ncbi:helix-hairpin-helix domain-containing protein [uncultured Microscilla sp.]|uniref:helix-hairpin-helix domain-containing protein n=1 Tax=uncultured Microscilla sp. TaxID=432653 RepID=UPI00262778E2|nr:helix-hairpin-helix domain-containing protein [uncultured Microscilla sp.]